MLTDIVITFCLITLIGLIQLLHYPSFCFIAEKDFSEAMVFHQRRISLIVIPLMVSELLLSLLSLTIEVCLFNGLKLSLIALIWLTTFLVQVPLHNKLLAGKDLHLISKLVKTNWIRTGLWSLKGILYVWYL